MQVSFNKRTILPSVYRKDDKVYLSTTLLAPVRHNLMPAPGVMPVEQIQAVLADCADNAQECEIEFNQTQGKFGPVFEIYSVKPLPKKGS